MRYASSLDAIADDGGPQTLPIPEPENETARRRQEDSRTTSSSSSPVPPDNEESDFFLVANDSQSSLGVPNIQDMQVYDDECLQPIQRLPNEILIAVFAKLGTSTDLFNAMLTCRKWARNAVEILWHRPSCSTWPKHEIVCQTLTLENPSFAYREFIRRLNLASLADGINDGSVMALSECTRIERLTLTGCSNLTDSGLIALISNNTHLYSLDISLLPAAATGTTFRDNITAASIDAITEHCPRLQGLNISGCQKISNDSLVRLAQRCRYIKRLKFNECSQIQDKAVLAFAENCPNILEIDLQQCRHIGNEPVTALFTKGNALRELRLGGCDLVDDSAFLALPPNRTYDHLRILDLSNSTGVTDRAIEKIIEVAPRLRNLVLQKCRNLTDASVYAISRLGRNLHFLHMGHCSQITDDGVKRLVTMCNRIRYIDLGCCHNLTDDSITRLAALPKLKRIGLVKCASITDASVIALANANRRPRMRRDAHGNHIPGEYSSSQSCLERVHLSYCINLTQASIIRLLNCCPRLTHLSLTGVQEFLREDLEHYSRPAPPEFTDHQRSVFCVFSGQGVVGLRKHFNRLIQAEETRRSARPVPADAPIFPPPPQGASPLIELSVDGDQDGIEDDDVPEDDMVIDTQPLLNQHNIGLVLNPAAPGTIPAPPPVPAAPPSLEPLDTDDDPFGYVSGYPVQHVYSANLEAILPSLAESQASNSGQGNTGGSAAEQSATTGGATNNHAQPTVYHAPIDISADPGQYLNHNPPGAN